MKTPACRRLAPAVAHALWCSCKQPCGPRLPGSSSSGCSNRFIVAALVRPSRTAALNAACPAIPARHSTLHCHQAASEAAGRRAGRTRQPRRSYLLQHCNAALGPRFCNSSGQPRHQAAAPGWIADRASRDCTSKAACRDCIAALAAASP